MYVLIFRQNIVEKMFIHLKQRVEASCLGLLSTWLVEQQVESLLIDLSLIVAIRNRGVSLLHLFLGFTSYILCNRYISSDVV